MFKRKVWSCVAFALAFIATSNVDPTSMWMLYEPDVPECLKK